MICTNCRSEIGNQPTCPYCGKLALNPYGSGAPEQKTLKVEEFSRQPGGVNCHRCQSTLKKLTNQIYWLELRSKITLILLSGSLLLNLFILILLAIR